MGWQERRLEGAGEETIQSGGLGGPVQPAGEAFELPGIFLLDGLQELGHQVATEALPDQRIHELVVAELLAEMIAYETKVGIIRTQPPQLRVSKGGQE